MKLKVLFLLCIINILLACSPQNHAVVGKWESEFVGSEITFYPDKTVAIMMMKAKWSEINANTVKIEAIISDQPIIIEFSIRSDEKNTYGILHYIIDQKYIKME